jgi:hypothetical protein
MLFSIEVEYAYLRFHLEEKDYLEKDFEEMCSY